MNTNNRAMGRAWPLALALMCPAGSWAYTCTADIPDIVVFYNGVPADAPSDLTVRCTRTLSEPDSVDYRALAFMGLNPIVAVSPYRSVQLGSSGYRLLYALRRYDYPNTCGNTTNWLAGNSDVIDRDVSFYPSFRTESSHRHPICVRVVGPVSPLDQLPVTGTYTDQLRVTVEFQGVGAPGPITMLVPVIVYVSSHCKVRSPSALVFNYTSFNRRNVQGSTRAGVTCSAKTTWTATIDPPHGTVAGVAYTLGMRRPADTGTGYEQDIDIDGTMPAGQAGTCGTGRCTASQTHTLTIRY